MTPLDAMLAIVDECGRRTRTKARTLRTYRALTVLGMNRAQAITVMDRMELVHADGSAFVPELRGAEPWQQGVAS